MKRVIFILILLSLFLGVQPFTFAQEITEEEYFTRESDWEEIVPAQANDFIESANSYWAEGDYDKARRQFEFALKLDPNNASLVSAIQEVELERLERAHHQAMIDKKILEDKRVLDSDKAWLIEEPTTNVPWPGIQKRITNKLKAEAESKVVGIDFSDAKLTKVLHYLSDVSDINIVFDDSAVSKAGTISIKIKDVTVVKALEMILRSKGLAYSFEEDYIWVTTKSAIENEDFTTRIYHLSQGLATYTTFTTFDTVTIKALRADKLIVASSSSGGIEEGEGEEGAEDRGTYDDGVDTFEGVKIGGSGGVDGKIALTIKDVLEEIVAWPEGSSIFLDNRTSTLIVRNTPSNLALLEQALEVLDVAPPQVMIEARFVEIGDDDLFSLGLKVSGQVTATGSNQPHSYPFNKNENNKFVDAFPTSSAGDFTLGKLDLSQFQAMLSAIEQNTKNNTLSSPKITTISGQEAIIKIVKEYRYPTKYEVKTWESDNKTYFTTVPADFKTRDIGIILKVTPNVGTDGKTINLTLVPEVSEFDIEKDMYNFGTEAQPFKQPFFAVRNCTASIVVNNNDTVVMGGLMREVVEHTVDRIPVVGSLPIVGSLFSRKYDNKQKRNLLIFVTARIIAPTGETVESNSDSI
ncbi:MAG: hypothetical protein GY853_09200 [PVC group bacterium]|nr:hypothetical protein [PVC group bacterium]